MKTQKTLTCTSLLANVLGSKISWIILILLCSTKGITSPIEEFEDDTFDSILYSYKDAVNKLIDDFDPVIAATRVVVPNQECQLTVSVAKENSICTGNNGTATARGIGGTGSISYQWSNGQSGSTITNLAPDTYTVTATDANGCINNATVKVGQEIRKIFPSVTARNSLCESNSGTLTASSSRFGPSKYVWSNSGSGRTIGGLAPNTYTVTVTDNRGCIGTAEGTVGRDRSIISVTVLPRSSICTADNGSLIATASGEYEPFKYLWSNSSQSSTITNLAPDTYVVTVTDKVGCTFTTSAEVRQANTNLDVSTSITNSICTANNGSIVASARGGSSPYRYEWSNARRSSTITNLAPNTYSVTVTDALGCTGVAEAIVSQENTSLSIALTTTNSICTSNGAVSTSVVGGTGSLSYQWSNGQSGPTLTNLEPDSYAVTVTDENGCTNQDFAIAIVRYVNPTLSVTLTSTNSICEANNGSVSASVSNATGSLSYIWSNGLSGPTITNLEPDGYAVTVSDINGCTNVTDPPVFDIAIVRQVNTSFSVGLTTTNTICTAKNGTVSSSVNGGTGSISYQWDNGKTSPNITNLASSSYGLTVTDANGCTDSDHTVVRQENPKISVYITTTNTICTANNGSVISQVNGGIGSISYQWDNGKTSPNITNLASESYGLTVTDIYGCTDSDHTVVRQDNPTVSVNISATNSICTANNGTIIASAGDGQSPFKYAWSNSSQGETITNLAPNTYSVTATDALGCTGIGDATVETEIIPPMVFIPSIPSGLCSNAGIQSGLGGGMPQGGVYSGLGITDDENGMTYTFDPATNSGAELIILKYTYTDANGCIGEVSEQLDVLALPAVSAGVYDPVCNDGDHITLSGSPSGGTFTGNGILGNTFDPSVGSQTITYSFTGLNGCSNFATTDIEVFESPIVMFSGPADMCVSVSTSTKLNGGMPAQGTATGDKGIYSGPGVNDDGNGTSFSFSPATAGVGVHTLTYTYTNARGCSNSKTDMIEVFALPTVTFTALADLCIDAGTQTALGGGLPSGGIYSGDGVTDDGNGMTYTFDPATATAGTHSITYNFKDTNSCGDSASDNVEVFALPTVTFTALADICIDAETQNGLDGGLPSGGVYSGDGVTDNGDGMTYSFNPAAVTTGSHPIKYSFTDTNGCSAEASDDVEVFALPVVKLSIPDMTCSEAGIQTDLNGGSPSGGIYSGTGVSDDGNGMAYTFDPNTAGAGTVSYTFTDDIGCTNSATDMTDIELCVQLSDYSFDDPCDCSDPRNIVIASDIANSLFYNKLVLGPVTSDLTVQLTANDDEMLDMSGIALPINTTMMTEVVGSPGLYELEFYHKNLTATSFTMTVNGMEYELTSDICEFDHDCLIQLGIPTMGQWGLLILALIMMSLGCAYMLKSSTRLA